MLDVQGTALRQSGFVVFSLPRSRSFWLSCFLNYGDWTCGHDEIRHVRSLQDVTAWLGMSNTGTIETAAAPFWRLLPSQTRVCVIRRPVADVVASMLRTGVEYDEGGLWREMRKLDAKLDQIASRVPNALSLDYADLVTEDGCARVFEHCLPYAHDRNWFAAASPLNMQVNVPAMVRYFHAHQAQLANAARQAKQAMLAKFISRPVASDRFTFQQESFRSFLRDGTALFAEHLIAVGEAPNAYDEKNLPLLQKLDDIGALQITTARSNGRMFGYLMTIVCPSLESVSKTEALNTTFYASRHAPGIGIKLQRASLAALRTRGVDSVTFRAGTRGGGPRMGALYRRLGAEDFGQLFTLDIKGAA